MKFLMLTKAEILIGPVYEDRRTRTTTNTQKTAEYPSHKVWYGALTQVHEALCLSCRHDYGALQNDTIVDQNLSKRPR